MIIDLVGWSEKFRKWREFSIGICVVENYKLCWALIIIIIIMVVIMGALEGKEVYGKVWEFLYYMLDVGELQAEMAGALTDRR